MKQVNQQLNVLIAQLMFSVLFLESVVRLQTLKEELSTQLLLPADGLIEEESSSNIFLIFEF